MKQLKIQLIIFFFIVIYSIPSKAQGGFDLFKDFEFPVKIYQYSYGIAGGVTKGRATFIDLGGEFHWQKMKLVSPRTWAVGANVSYNFTDNIIGYRAEGWTRKGRLNLIYGLHAAYYSDFENGRFGFGPNIGFRILNIHFGTGANIFISNPNEKLRKATNGLYVNLKYYLPIKNTYSVDKKDD